MFQFGAVVGLGFVLALGLHGYCYRRWVKYWRLGRGGRWVLRIVLLLSATVAAVASSSAAFFVLSRGHAPLPLHWKTVLSWITYVWMGCFGIICILLAFTGGAYLLGRAALAYCGWQRMHLPVLLRRTAPLADAARVTWDTPSGVSPERRFFLHRSLDVAMLGSAGLAIAEGFREALGTVAITPVEVTLPRWPAALDGLRIVQLSDIHIGVAATAPKRDWLAAIVAQVNAQQPDLIVLTGDLVDGSVAQLRHDVAPFADLRAPLGVYGVTGNHEYYSGVEAWTRHLPTLGVRMLRNQHIPLTLRGERFDLAGVEDYRSSNWGGIGSDIPAALTGRDATRPVILLAHQPKSVLEAAEYGVDLQLSGHTHQGQIWPMGLIVRLAQPYVYGLHQHSERTQIFVSRGVGYWGPPMRVAAPPEIVLLTLRAAPDLGRQA